MSGKVTEDRISKALTDLFGLKGHVLGFKTDAGLIWIMSGQYYDTETFCRQKSKFFGDVVDVMEATEQLEVSCKMNAI